MPLPVRPVPAIILALAIALTLGFVIGRQSSAPPVVEERDV